MSDDDILSQLEQFEQEQKKRESSAPSVSEGSAPAPAETKKKPQKRPKPEATESEGTESLTTKKQVTEEDLKRVLESSTVVQSIIEEIITKRLDAELPVESEKGIKDLLDNRTRLEDLFEYNLFFKWLNDLVKNDPMAIGTNQTDIFKIMDARMAKTYPDLAKAVGWKTNDHAERNLPQNLFKLIERFILANYIDPTQDAGFYIELFQIFKKSILNGGSK